MKKCIAIRWPSNQPRHRNEYSYSNMYIQRVPKANIIYICLRNVIYKMNARRKRSYTIRLTTFSCTNARLIRSISKPKQSKSVAVIYCEETGCIDYSYQTLLLLDMIFYLHGIKPTRKQLPFLVRVTNIRKVYIYLITCSNIS